jgi:hypothetical protein
MCDYSMTVEQSRPAVEGERLVVHRFSNGVKGFVSPPDLAATIEAETGWWRRALSWLGAGRNPCAICLDPGAKLVLRDVPEVLQSSLQLEPEEEVTVTHRGFPGSHRDAVRFRHGREILVQELPIGLIADVLSTDRRPIDLPRAQHPTVDHAPASPTRTP